MYAQLYIYDPQAALEHCHHQNASLNVDTLCILQRVILNNHQYAAIYKHAHAILQGYDPQKDVCIHLHVALGSDCQRYNLLTADEVMVILPTDANPEKNS